MGFRLISDLILLLKIYFERKLCKVLTLSERVSGHQGLEELNTHTILHNEHISLFLVNCRARFSQHPGYSPREYDTATSELLRAPSFGMLAGD